MSLSEESEELLGKVRQALESRDRDAARIVSLRSDLVERDVVEEFLKRDLAASQKQRVDYDTAQSKEPKGMEARCEVLERDVGRLRLALQDAERRAQAAETKVLELKEAAAERAVQDAEVEKTRVAVHEHVISKLNPGLSAAEVAEMREQAERPEGPCRHGARVTAESPVFLAPTSREVLLCEHGNLPPGEHGCETCRSNFLRNARNRLGTTTDWPRHHVDPAHVLAGLRVAEDERVPPGVLWVRPEVAERFEQVALSAALDRLGISHRKYQDEPGPAAHVAGEDRGLVRWVVVKCCAGCVREALHYGACQDREGMSRQPAEVRDEREVAPCEDVLASERTSNGTREVVVSVTRPMKCVHGVPHGGPGCLECEL